MSKKIEKLWVGLEKERLERWVAKKKGEIKSDLDKIVETINNLEIKFNALHVEKFVQCISEVLEDPTYFADEVPDLNATYREFYERLEEIANLVRGIQSVGLAARIGATDILLEYSHQ